MSASLWSRRACSDASVATQSLAEHQPNEPLRQLSVAISPGVGIRGLWKDPEQPAKGRRNRRSGPGFAPGQRDEGHHQRSNKHHHRDQEQQAAADPHHLVEMDLQADKQEDNTRHSKTQLAPEPMDLMVG